MTDTVRTGEPATVGVAGRRRSPEVRMLVALGLAVAAWLMIVPTSTRVSAEGGEVTGCRTPVFNMADAAANFDGVHDSCLERNKLRVAKGVYALAGVGVLLAGDSLVRMWREPISKRRQEPNPQSWYDDA